MQGHLNLRDRAVTDLITGRAAVNVAVTAAASNGPRQ